MIPARLLLGRFLTRSGDQAWDFAVPLVLLMIFPDQLRVAALYFFLTKLLNVLLLPRMASLIDQMNRAKAAKLGILLQLLGVVIGALAIAKLANVNSNEPPWNSLTALLTFSLLIVGGVFSSLGSVFMDIAIANDLVPTSLSADQLGSFNSRLRQVDLFTEVTSPVIAGLLLLLNEPLLLGFYIIATWNVLSFLPELALLRSIFRERPDLVEKKVAAPEQTKKSILQKLSGGWSAFMREPIALASVAYAFLWLSVLSPHGVLLTGYLKDGWKLEEWAIGSFRGAGAIFGLLATLIFPVVIKRVGLIRGTWSFIVAQTVSLLLALGFFVFGGVVGQVGFLILILLSRVGLYGFSLGEMQIRQTGIDPKVRGEVNGFATALTGIATLVLYGAGALLPSTESFKILIIGSVLSVVIGALVFTIWVYKNDQAKKRYRT